MEYTQDITLDLNPSSPRLVIYAKQGDVNTRKLHIHFTKDGENYSTSGNNILLRLHTPDNRTVVNLYTPENDGSVIVTLNADALVSSGRAYGDLAIIDGEENVLSTATFIINIVDSPSVDSGLVTTDEETFFNFIGTAQRYVEDAQAWANGSRGSDPVATTDDAYENNAKYWAQQAHTEVANFQLEGVTIGIGSPAIPGTAGEITKTTTNEFLFHAPTINLHATATAATAVGEEIGVEVAVQSYPSVEEPQESYLQKNLAFSFTFPKNSIELSTSLTPSDAGKAADASAVGSAIALATSNINANNITGVVSINHGGTGANTASAARANLEIQEIKVANISILSNNWSNNSATILVANGLPVTTTEINFISSPSGPTNWKAAQDIGLCAPTVLLEDVINNNEVVAKKWSLCWECDIMPTEGSIGITTYWW